MERARVDLPDTFLWAVDLEVRVGDLNYGGHLSNDAVLAFLHEARLRWLGALGFTERDAGGAGLIMVDAVVVYKAQAFRGDVLRVEVTAGGIDRYGFDLFYRCRDAARGRDVVHAKTGMAAFDYGRGRIVPLPPETAAALSRGPASL